MTDLPKRKRNRLEDYDYSQNGAYFITICTKDRKKLFGEITVGAATCRPNIETRPHDIPHVKLSALGEIIIEAIENISSIYQCVTVDKYVVMPNHLHLTVIVHGYGRQVASQYGRQVASQYGRQVAAPTTVNTIIGNMKRYVSMQIGFSPWQKSFHDHIIRNERSYQKIAKYIEDNPITWKEDCFYV